MTATSADVAQRAGVSRATVSQILNGRGARFAKATRDRVTRAAEELDYRPSAAGRALAKGASDYVVALIPNTTFGGNLQDIYESMTVELSRHGLTLLLHLSTDAQALDHLVSTSIPTAVVSLTRFTDEERTVLHKRGVFGFDAAAAGDDSNAAIGRVQAMHLIERGFERLAFAHLRDAREDPFGMSRVVGVARALEELGRRPPIEVGLGIDLSDAAAALDQLGDERIGIVCYNDDVALTLLSAAGLRGRRIPESLGLIGMDRIALSQVSTPRLTTIGIDAAAVARHSAASTLHALGLGPAPASTIPLELVQGQTT